MKQDGNLDVFFLGDIYFGEWHMRLRAKKGKYNVLKEKGYLHFGKNFEEMLSNGDEVIANLECAITDIPVSPLESTNKRHIYSAREEGTFKALKALSVSTLLLANNHTVDYGQDGLKDTLAAIKRNGINAIGAGIDEETASQAHFLEKKIDDLVFSMAIISVYNYTSRSDRWGFYAKGLVPGVNALDAKKIEKQIKQLKQENNELCLLLSPHWGSNYAWRSYSQQQMGQSLINAGVDLIVGHSAHMFQEVEYYKNKLIVYSIGNFIFNADGEYKKRNLPPYSFIARLNVQNIDNSLQKKMMLYPFLCCNKEIDFTLRFVNAEEFEHIIMIIKSHNFDMESAGKLFEYGKDQYGYYIEYNV